MWPMLSEPGLRICPVRLLRLGLLRTPEGSPALLRKILVHERAVLVGAIQPDDDDHSPTICDCHCLAPVCYVRHESFVRHHYHDTSDDSLLACRYEQRYPLALPFVPLIKSVGRIQGTPLPTTKSLPLPCLNLSQRRRLSILARRQSMSLPRHLGLHLRRIP